MKRLTTDDPHGGTELLLNLFRWKCGYVMIDWDGELLDYAELIARVARASGRCENPSREDIVEGTAVGDCDGCLLCLMYAMGYGFAEVRERLRKIEDILGDDYDLDHVRELIMGGKYEGK